MVDGGWRCERPEVGNYLGFHHVTFWVGNAKQAATFYATRHGFKAIAYRGLETGHRDVVTHVVRKNNVTFVFQSALTPGNAAMTEFLGVHGDAPKDIAFEVDDARAIFAGAVSRGARAVRAPWEETDEHGTVVMATIGVYGDTEHTFVQRCGYNGTYLPGYSVPRFVDPLQDTLPEVPINFIDHFVANQASNMVTSTAEMYEQLGFHRFWSIDDSQVYTEYSALRSVIVANYDENIRIPITEPADGSGKSQVQEFVDYNGGPGVQHIAFNTDDIIAVCKSMRQRGMEFLPVPATYYDNLKLRLATSACKVAEDINTLRSLDILVDFDSEGYLLQAFTRPCQDRPTLFIEIIQRENHLGFGVGNFKAVYEAIERTQAERGNL
ncbi:4-hydroxyphenylpyruvic acid dioxgenase [Ramicandelaber brevisporus]|nr:4-hydroxyphenylpyruvic acid dioxgenase [Ramicandelaber brevisporus]